MKVKPTVPVVQDHWVKISEHPPSFQPRVCVANNDTSYRSGDWFEIGDAAGSRFFIPFKVAGSRQSLIDEVIAARSEKKQREILHTKVASRSKDSGLFLLSLPLGIVGGMGGADIYSHR
jgi:hypothetical protein